MKMLVHIHVARHESLPVHRLRLS